MKRFLLLLFFSPCVGYTQTALIFHKSHSGSAAAYASSRLGNFGETPEMRSRPTILPGINYKQQVTRLNDSVVIVKTEGFSDADTILHHPVLSNSSISLDSLKKIYPMNEYINFEEQPDNAKSVKGKESKTPVDKTKKSKKEGPKKERRSDLWMLWVIGGGTFLGIGLSGSGNRKKQQTVHA